MNEMLHFAVDRMLGRLCKWLRILGLDSWYVSIDSRRQIEDYRKDGRIVLTRSEKWRHCKGVIFIDHDNPMVQLQGVLQTLNLDPQRIRPLHLCIRCNHPLIEIPRAQVFGRVPEHVYATTETFCMCSKCHNIYWRGSHPLRMAQQLEQLLGRNAFSGHLKEGEA